MNQELSRYLYWQTCVDKERTNSSRPDISIHFSCPSIVGIRTEPVYLMGSDCDHFIPSYRWRLGDASKCT